MTLARYKMVFGRDAAIDPVMEKSGDGAWVRYNDVLLRGVQAASALSQASEGLTNDWHPEKKAALARHIEALLQEGAYQEPPLIDRMEMPERRDLMPCLLCILGLIAVGLVLGWLIWGTR